MAQLTATEARMTSLTARGYRLTVERMPDERVMVTARHEHWGNEEFSIAPTLAGAVDGVGLCVDRVEEAKDRR